MSQHVKVIYTEEVEVTRERDTGDDWDGDDLAYAYSIHGIKKVGPNESYELVIDEPVQDNYFLVWVRYSTGDSFHSETGRIEFVHLCRTREDAEYLAEKLNKASGYRMEVTLPSGEKIEVYSCWTGYFETLEAVEWDAFILK